MKVQSRDVMNDDGMMMMMSWMVQDDAILVKDIVRG